MTARNTDLRYGSVAMTFHWVIAISVLANLVVGFGMHEIPRDHPNVMIAYNIHKSIGLTVLTLSILRLAWRLMNPQPPLPASLNPLLKVAAHVSHFLLYVLMIGTPLTGWIMSSSGKRIFPVDFFALGLFDLPPIAFLANMSLEDRAPFRAFGHDGHMILIWCFIALIPIHVGAALYHHFVRKDQVLKRMLPGTTVTGG